MAGTLSIKIALTPEQQAQIKRATGASAPGLELKLEPLEERLASRTTSK